MVCRALSVNNLDTLQQISKSTPKEPEANVEKIPINNNANDMDASQVETLNITL